MTTQDDRIERVADWLAAEYGPDLPMMTKREHWLLDAAELMAALDPEPRRLNTTEITLLVFATRYALGRMSMAPSLIDRYIRKHMYSLTVNDKRQIADEIDEYDERYSLGMDCDRSRWLTLRDDLRTMAAGEANHAE